MTDDEETHASILAAAIAVVADVGYRSASLSAVAAGAGVDAAVVEHRFPSKSMLMSEAAAWIYGDQAHYIGSRVELESEGLARIQAYIRTICTYYYERPRYLWALNSVIESGELVGFTGDRMSERWWQAPADMLADSQRRACWAHSIRKRWQ